MESIKPTTFNPVFTQLPRYSLQSRSIAGDVSAQPSQQRKQHSWLLDDDDGRQHTDQPQPSVAVVVRIVCVTLGVEGLL